MMMMRNLNVVYNTWTHTHIKMDFPFISYSRFFSYSQLNIFTKRKKIAYLMMMMMIGIKSITCRIRWEKEKISFMINRLVVAMNICFRSFFSFYLMPKKKLQPNELDPYEIVKIQSCSDLDFFSNYCYCYYWLNFGTKKSIFTLYHLSIIIYDSKWKSCHYH